MRCVAPWIAALGIWLTGSTASARPPTVTWRAPATCPEARAIEAMVQRSVEPDSEPAIRHVQAQITRVADGYEMVLSLHTAAAIHQKRFVADLCSSLVEVLSLELGFSSWSGPGAALEHIPKAALRWGLHVGGDVRTSPSPMPSAGLTLGVFLSRMRLRAELRASYALPRELRYRSPREVGGRFESFGAEARGCYTVPLGPVALPLCAGAEIGALRARGVGVSPASTATRLAAGVFVGPALQVPIAGPVAAWFELVGVVQLIIPRFGVRNLPPLYQPGRLGLRGGLGIMFTFG